VTGASAPGIRNLTSKKFASRTSTNQTQVLRGGIVAGPTPFEAPGPLFAGWTRPDGTESLLRRVELMVIAAPRQPGRLRQTDRNARQQRRYRQGSSRKQARASKEVGAFLAGVAPLDAVSRDDRGWLVTAGDFLWLVFFIDRGARLDPCQTLAELELRNENTCAFDGTGAIAPPGVAAQDAAEVAFEIGDRPLVASPSGASRPHHPRVACCSRRPSR
jgi:hypothetical protein